MALTKVIGQGLGSLGGGAAVDAKIVFDGNAQDYHIGLDDSADTLVIGKGSALGTTTAMSFDANGIVTKPLQPAFLAVPASQQNNLTADNSAQLISFGTEVFDQNADFASNTFTAPVTGRYQLSMSLRVEQSDTAAGYHIWQIVTSNRTYQAIRTLSGLSADPEYQDFGLSILADMDASDTAQVKVLIEQGANQTDIDTNSYFSGCLIA